jgi:hypothetical protein
MTFLIPGYDPSPHAFPEQADRILVGFDAFLLIQITPLGGAQTDLCLRVFCSLFGGRIVSRADTRSRYVNEVCQEAQTIISFRTAQPCLLTSPEAHGRFAAATLQHYLTRYKH